MNAITVGYGEKELDHLWYYRYYRWIFLLVTAVVVPAVSASNNDIDCLKEKLRRICQSDPKPEYFDLKIFLDV